MAELAELGITAVDKVVDKYGEDGYDTIRSLNPLSSSRNQRNSRQQQQQSQPAASVQDNGDDRQSNRSSRRDRPHQHRHTAELPSPERERSNHHYYYPPADPPLPGDRDFERQSETSDRVLRDYESERDDPRRRPRPHHYPASNMSRGYDDRRPSSQAGRSRYDDDGSDYDEHNGRRRHASGRGYDDRRDYDREIIETEVYRGPPRDWANQRSPDSHVDNGEYAVAQYRGTNNNNGDLAPYDSKRRSRSRGRNDKDRDYYSERDRSRSRSNEGIRGKLDDAFDTSARGIGAGVVGAVVGGLAGRQFGDKRHNQRDMIIGAVVGGLAVNAAENKYRTWKEERDGDKDEGRYERDYRSRSAMR